LRRRVASLLLTLAALPALAGEWAWELPPGFPPPPVPEDNPMSAAKVELGRRLFHDPVLSGNGTQSCAGCHRPDRAFTDGRARALGSTGAEHPRSAMSLANVAYNLTFTWQDPALGSLERQALVPLFNEHPVEMGLAGNEEAVLRKLRDDLNYRELFEAAFPGSGEPVSIDHAVKAIASFERTLIAGDAPYFRWIFRDERDALSDAAKRGARLFFSDELKCSTCHDGFTFSGPIRAPGLDDVAPTFHNTGLYDVDGEGSYPPASPGVENRGAFRAPTLLNVALTAPYMHDGSIATLGEVLDFYAAGGRGPGRTNRFKSERVAGFALSAEQKADMLAFLDSLTDREFVENPRFRAPEGLSSPHE